MVAAMAMLRWRTHRRKIFPRHGRGPEAHARENRASNTHAPRRIGIPVGRRGVVNMWPDPAAHMYPHIAAQLGL